MLTNRSSPAFHASARGAFSRRPWWFAVLAMPAKVRRPSLGNEGYVPSARHIVGGQIERTTGSRGNDTSRTVARDALQHLVIAALSRRGPDKADSGTVPGCNSNIYVLNLFYIPDWTIPGLSGTRAVSGGGTAVPALREMRCEESAVVGVAFDDDPTTRARIRFRGCSDRIVVRIVVFIDGRTVGHGNSVAIHSLTIHRRDRASKRKRRAPRARIRLPPMKYGCSNLWARTARARGWLFSPGTVPSAE